MNIGIFIYNEGKNGGAEKRYYNLIKALSESHEIFVLTNKSVLEFWISLGGFSNKVIVQLIGNRRHKQTIDEIGSYAKNNKGQNKIEFKRIVPSNIRSYYNEMNSILSRNIIAYKWASNNKLTHVNALGYAGIYSIFLRLSGRKLVFSYFDYMVQNGYPFYWFRNQGLKTVVRIANQIDFLSSMIPERMISKGLVIKPSKMNIAPVSFIDYSKTNFDTSKRNILVFVGRFEEIKNPILALKVARVLKQREISFFLKMIGYGSLYDEMNNYIVTNHLGNHVIVLRTDFVEEELADALIFLSLQKDNNYPSQSLLEAMASGCIPIVTDVGETRKLVQEEDGFLVNEDEYEISDHVENILNNPEIFLKKAINNSNRIRNDFSVMNYLKYYNNLFVK